MPTPNGYALTMLWWVSESWLTDLKDHNLILFDYCLMLHSREKGIWKVRASSVMMLNKQLSNNQLVMFEWHLLLVGGLWLLKRKLALVPYHDCAGYYGSYVSLVLANIMSESSCCFWEHDKNAQSKFCVMVWMDYGLLCTYIHPLLGASEFGV
jgi:hypothetical protein